MKCPRCGSHTMTSISISAVSFEGCASCYLPKNYYAAYKKEYESTPDCPFCDGLGELNYARRQNTAHIWAPCLYCRLDEYKEWLNRNSEV